MIEAFEVHAGGSRVVIEAEPHIVDSPRDGAAVGAVTTKICGGTDKRDASVQAQAAVV
jgi:hypothetical protein